MIPLVKVPCNGCTACCRNDLLFLHPELGDIAASYQTQSAVNPITGREGLALKHKPEGGCIYLGEEGCTIHDRAPAICREFDCRRFYLGFTDRAERRRLVRQGFVSKDVLDAGRAPPAHTGKGIRRMTCIKTGCQVFLDGYQEYAYGDAFLIDGVYLFRLCERSFTPINWPIKHFTIENYANWFDDDRTSQKINSTLIAEAKDVTDHGYDGIGTPPLTDIQRSIIDGTFGVRSATDEERAEVGIAQDEENKP